jgi:hypothetical protein
MKNNIIQTNLPVFQKVIKYIIMALIVISATKYIPEYNIKNKEIIMIGISSAITFAILDMVSPSIKMTHQK